jgi:enamine deaminase RidA (YjgF/YER057c/UK114 family)
MSLQLKAVVVNAVVTAALIGCISAMTKYLVPNRKHNASDAPLPLARYVNAVEVQGGKRLLFISGQMGATSDGQIAATLPEQCRACFRNIEAVLKDAKMKWEDLVKLTVYIKSAPGGQNASSVQTYRNARDEAMGMNTTASTLVFVEALNAPEILIQIEAVAAR